MLKKLPLFSALAVAPLIVPALPALAADAAGSKPNIIFILVDDMGWGDLNINWDAHGTAFNNRDRANKFATPQLDQLAKDGMLLLRHYTAAPVSAPARASLLTGVHQGHARMVRDNSFDTSIENSHTLGTVLKSAGYNTAAIGKWGVGGTTGTGFGHPNNRGFDYFYGAMAHTVGHYHYPASSGQSIFENQTEIHEALAAAGTAYDTDLYTARAKNWISENVPTKTGKPFFLYLAHPAPHGSLRVPPSSYPSGKGATGGVQWVAGTNGTFTCNTATQELAEAAGATWAGVDGYIHPDNASFSTKVARRHSTMIRRVDDSVEDLRALLNDLGIADNTIIVFTSDNGPHLEAGNDNGSSGLYTESSGTQDPTFFKSYGMMDGTKRDCYEGGIRVPTIVCWPTKIAKNSTSLNPSQFHDWMATFADVAGVEIPSRSDGVSLLPSLTGEGTQKKSEIYIEYNVTDATKSYADFLESHKGKVWANQFVVYVDGYKGVKKGVSGNISDVVFEIYEPETDPQEATDLAGTEVDTSRNLQARMRAKLLGSRRAGDGNGWSGRDYLDTVANAVPAENPPAGTLAQGLKWEVYRSENAFPWVPDLRQTHLPIFATGSRADARLPKEAAVSGAKAVSLEGWIEVPTSGAYVFYAKTDAENGSKAFIHLHDMQLLDADFTYTAGTLADSYMNVGTQRTAGTKPVYLAAGKHPIRIEYCGNGSAPSLDLQWKTPNSTTAVNIPASAFSCSAGTAEVATDYATWKSTAFKIDLSTADADTLARTEPMAIFSGDGVTNLLKYALGLDPTQRNGALGIVEYKQVEGLDGNAETLLSVKYPLNPNANGIVFIGERWDNESRIWTDENVEMAFDAGTLTLSSTVPVGSDPAVTRQFLRLRVKKSD